MSERVRVQGVRIGWTLTFAIVTLGVLIAAGLALAAPAGTPDRSFGGDGKVVTDLGQPYESIADTAIDARGRIVAAGGTDERQVALARYRRNGRLDRSLGNDGKVITACRDVADANGVAIDPKGRIVIAGGCLAQDENGEVLVARYTPSGALDRSFGDRAMVLTGGAYPGVGVAIDSQGRIVVAAARGGHGNNGFAVFRYTPDGGPDPTFGGDGEVVTDAHRAGPAAVAVGAQDQIVVGGFGTRRNSDFELLRYRVDGTLDPSFGGDGTVFTNFGARWDRIHSIAIDGRGRIVAAGTSGLDPRSYDSNAFAVARYLPDGRVDDSFSRNGKAKAHFKAFGIADDVAVDSQRRIVAAGWKARTKHRTLRGQAFALARWRPRGRLDPSFSGNGKLTIRFKHWSEAHAVSIDSRDRIVAGGQLAAFNFALARYIG